MIEPRYQDAEVTLYCADCLDVLPQLEAIDALIIDPPFGIGFKYNEHNDNMTPEQYGAWLWNIIETAENKASGGAPVFVFQAMLNCRHFSGWFPRDYRIYAACKNFVQMRPTEMQYSYDPVIVWWKEGKRYAAGTASRDYFVANTSPSSHVGLNDAGEHPCARPLDQMRQIIEQWTRPGSVVLDCFMGSGTTGVACAQLGRRFIGIEIDEKYYQIAEKRIRQARQQLRLGI